MTNTLPPAILLDDSTEYAARLSEFESTVEHHFADSDGISIHYAAAGSGPLMVFLHGFPDHWLGWWQLMDAFRDDYRVVAMDLRGYNLSDKPSASDAYQIDRLVDDVRAVLRSEGAEKSILVGHDWGGFIAWHAAMKTSNLASRLVILNMPHPWAIARELALNPDQRKASEYVKLFRLPNASTKIPLERLGAWVREPSFKQRHDIAMAGSYLDGMLAYYRENWPTEPYQLRWNKPELVTAPTLIMHGLADPYALPAGLNSCWEWVDAEVTIKTFPGHGHFIQHENAAQVVNTMRDWLD